MKIYPQPPGCSYNGQIEASLQQNAWTPFAKPALVLVVARVVLGNDGDQVLLVGKLGMIARIQLRWILLLARQKLSANADMLQVLLNVPQLLNHAFR